MIFSFFHQLLLWVNRATGFFLALILIGGSLMAIAAPSYAQIPFNSQEVHGQTVQQLTGRPKDAPLTPEERLDRAYSISEAAGLREEKRQAEGKFDPKADNKSLIEEVSDFFTDNQNNGQ